MMTGLTKMKAVAGAFCIAMALVIISGLSNFAELTNRAVSLAAQQVAPHGDQVAPHGNIAKKLPALGCHAEQLPGQPSRDHCEHVVRRAGPVSRSQLQKRHPVHSRKITMDLRLRPMDSARDTTSRHGTTRDFAKSGAPFKTVFAITTSMLN